MHAFTKAYEQQRGSVEYSDDKLRTDLLEHFSNTNEGIITSGMKPPVVIKAMDSPPAPGRWLQCIFICIGGNLPGNDSQFVLTVVVPTACQIAA